MRFRAYTYARTQYFLPPLWAAINGLIYILKPKFTNSMDFNSKFIILFQNIEWNVFLVI